MTVPPEEYLPLSPAQQEIWLGQSQNEDSPVFIIGECLVIPGPIDPDLLRRALQQVVDETDALRMRVDPNRPRFSIRARMEAPLRVLDYRDHEDGLTKAQAWMTAAMDHPIAFDGSPLARLTLILISSTQSLLHGAYHHVALDGLSVIFLMDRLAAIYTALVEGRDPPRPAAAEFRDKALADVNYPQTEAFRRDRDYWKELVSPPPPMASLALRPHAEAGFKPGIRSSLSLPRATADTLLQGGSLTQVLLAAAALYLHKITGRTDIVVGLAVGGRLSKAVRNLPGMYATVVPVRLTVDRIQNFADLCAGMGKQLRGALRHQRYRIEDVERDLHCSERAPFRRITVNAIPQARATNFAGHIGVVADMSNDPTEELVISVFDFIKDRPMPVDLIGHPDLFDVMELRAHHQRFLSLLEQLARPNAWEQTIATFSLTDPTTISHPSLSDTSAAIKYRKHASLWESTPLTAAQDAARATTTALRCAVRCSGSIDLNRLAQALDQLVERHDALRLVVFEINGQPRQRFAAHGRAELRIETGDPASNDNFSPPSATGSGPWLTLRVQRIHESDSRLTLELHPLVADTASAFLLLTELTGLLRGESLPPAISFSAHATGQAIARSSTAARKTRDFWQEKLTGGVSFELPWRSPDPSGKSTGERGQTSRNLPASMVKRLRKVAISQEVTTRDVLLAGWLSLCTHYSGRTDIVTGVVLPPPNRNGAILGCRERALPFRLDTADTSTFEELISKTAQTTQSLGAHQHVSEDILRDLSNATAGVVFEYLSATQTHWNWPDRKATLEQFPATPTAAAMAVRVNEVADASCEIVLDYDRAQVAGLNADRLARHVESHLTALLAAPEQRFDRIPIGDEAEQRRVLVEWNTTPGAPPSAECFPSLFRQSVERSPDAIALTHGDQSWSYRELDRWTDRLADHLVEQGAQPESVVGVLMDNSLLAVATIVGVLKSGAAYLPLDPANPPARLAYMLADAGVSWVVTRATWRSMVPDKPALTTIELDSLNLEGESPAKATARELLPAHLAYIIYTSGTTGEPKGVMVPHVNWTRVATWVAQNFDYGADSRVLLFSSLGFDVSAEVVGATLLTGGTLVCSSRLDMHPGPTLTRLLADQAINHISISPSALAVCPVADLPDLRTIVLGGEACPPGLARKWKQTAQLINGYGPTETTILATCDLPLRTDPVVTIGRPIGHYTAYVLNSRGTPVPLGVPGELYLGGVGVARGYLGRPGLTTERFVPDPFADQPGQRLYRTGDRVRYLDDGRLEFCGRVDEQVKVRGFRIELGEIDTVMRQCNGVDQAAVTLVHREDSDPQLVAYVTGTTDVESVRAHAARQLPAYMVPAQIVPVPAIPLTPNGKADVRALARIQPPAIPTPATPSPEFRQAHRQGASLVPTITSIWREVLGQESPGPDTNFFELGGNSLLLVQIQEKLGDSLDREIPIVDLFKHPTIRTLAEHLQPGGSETKPIASTAPQQPSTNGGADRDIAIIGMAGRFPGAPDIESYWQLLCDGREGITHFDSDALRAAGVSENKLNDADYVRSFGAIEHFADFDAEFFSFSPREAALMDPQHRIFLETAWHALENAGCDPSRPGGDIGVYAGSGANTYRSQLSGTDWLENPDAHLISLGNDKDFIPTRASYKLNLRGPSINVNTACSTSLVAVHLARQALINGECDIALAGGVTVLANQSSGYRFRAHGIFSPDGHCRAFSDDAHGTVPASGAGLVVLKRLSDAVRDRDMIHAVIQGSAINNDGAVKVGFTAPSVGGQVEVVRRALRDAGLNADQIEYMEAHGTGTELGDPIEIEALTKAFAADTDRTGYCALGSAKSNLGHTDAAAGAASLIKTSLSLSREYIPATLHCATPNPRIDFPGTPFHPVETARDWPRRSTPRHAGVSSFGLGGTNAHVVLREPPAPANPREPGSSAAHHLLVLSARDQPALEAQATRLAAHLETHPTENLVDTAFTLARGRRAFSTRRIVVGQNAGELQSRLRADPSRNDFREQVESNPRPVAFMFPGQGSQFAGMAAGLYEAEPNFRRRIDQGCALLPSPMGRELREILVDRIEGNASSRIHETCFAQPALFILQHALAQWWLEHGIQPAAFIGHSVGEITAACLAGVMRHEDALALITRRAELIQAQPPGSMAAVPLSLEALTPLLGDGVELAAQNGADRCVVTGESTAIDEFEDRLRKRGTRAIRLRTSHAFHSAMVEPAIEPLVDLVRTFQLNAPSTPVISGETGTWLTNDQATDPDYWGRHLRQPVHFHQGLTQVLNRQDESVALIEVGPGRTLATLAERHPDRTRAAVVVSSLPDEREPTPAHARLLGAVGRLWLHGQEFDWDTFYRDDSPRRIPLPLYPFQRKRHWIEPAAGATPSVSTTAPASTSTATSRELPVASADAPEGDAEEALATLWVEVLGTPTVGRRDNFFSLGGDSLLGVQLFTRIKEIFAVQLELETLFDTPTIEGLATAIENKIIEEIEAAGDAGA